MKKLIFSIVILSAFNVFAGLPTFCQGLVDANKTLLLFMSGTKITQVKVQTQGSLPKVFGATEVNRQDLTTIYRLSGVPGLVEVQNTVLNGQGGWLSIGSNRFDCEAN